MRPVTHLTGCLYWEGFPEASVTPASSGIWGRKKINHRDHSPSRKGKSGLVFLALAGNGDPGALSSLAPGGIRASVALEDTLAASGPTGPPVGPRAGASVREGRAGHVSPSGRAYPVPVAQPPSGEARPGARAHSPPPPRAATPPPPCSLWRQPTVSRSLQICGLGGPRPAEETGAQTREDRPQPSAAPGPAGGGERRGGAGETRAVGPGWGRRRRRSPRPGAAAGDPGPRAGSGGNGGARTRRLR